LLRLGVSPEPCGVDVAEISPEQTDAYQWPMPQIFASGWQSGSWVQSF
jgi:hypothetical protein